MASKNNYSWDKNNVFVNPYNFVSSDFSKGGTIDAAQEKGEYTGVLKCRMITKTPVAVPGDIIDIDGKKHKTYNFFHYEDGSYIIPGSSIRGAVRSVYETITDSCYITAKESALITRRSNKAYEPGILARTKDGWKLYPAERYIFKIKNYSDFAEDQGCYDEWLLEDLAAQGLHFGDKVTFQPQDKKYKKVGNYAKNIKKAAVNGNKGVIGYLYIGEAIHGKHFESVFYRKGKALAIEQSIFKSAIGRLEETIHLYNNESINRNLKCGHTGYKEYERAKRKGIIPLWYQLDETTGALSLSIACLGRIAYQHTMGDMLGKKVPCKNRNKLCKACVLFGMASEEKIGSRVRFSDAVIKKEDIKNIKQGHLPKLTLAELASPKYSYLPFYLKKPNNPQKQKIYDYDSEGAELRGRKFYWHSCEVRTTQERTERNATMEVIESNQQGFKFDVYYDNISRKQLKELIWTLTLGENNVDSKRCYKIGHGKPIGMGSVKIVIDEQIERKYGDDYKVNVHNVEAVEDVFEDTVIMREMLRIMNTDSMKQKDIRYPYVQNQKGPKDNNRAPHQWFGKNYKLGDLKPDYYLPEIMENCTMPSAVYNESSAIRENDSFKKHNKQKKY